MRKSWWMVLLCFGIAQTASAGLFDSFLSQLQNPGGGDGSETVAAPSDPGVAPAAVVDNSRISNITDVVIGDTPGTTYLGTSIWRPGGFLAWHNGRDDSIWVCRLDPDSGELQPANGKGVQIGKAAPFVGDTFMRSLFGIGRIGTNNGPEWGVSQQGLGLYLTTVDNNRIYQQSRCFMDNFPGLEVEQLTFGGNEHRFSNLATQNPEDPEAKVGFYKIPLTFGAFNATEIAPVFWQFDNPSAQEHQFPLDSFSFNGPRWIPHSPLLTTQITAPDETVQVAIYNTETEELEIITDGPEMHAEAEIVLDPDTNLPRYMTCVENQNAVAVYELIDGEWVKQRVVVPEIDPRFGNLAISIFAVKPLFVRGELFFYYNVYIGDVLTGLDFLTRTPIDIYLGSGDGTVNLRLTPATGSTFRLNPQYYIGTQDNKVFLYYYTNFPAPIVVYFGDYHRLSFTVDE